VRLSAEGYGSSFLNGSQFCQPFRGALENTFVSVHGGYGFPETGIRHVKGEGHKAFQES